MHLDFDVAHWPNYQKVGFLCATAVVLASIPATSSAGLWFAVVLAAMLIVSIFSGKSLSWE